jgi:hypothetical protein
VMGGGAVGVMDFNAAAPPVGLGASVDAGADADVGAGAVCALRILQLPSTAAVPALAASPSIGTGATSSGAHGSSQPFVLRFVVVDLKAPKDTVSILRNLNACFPVPLTETQVKWVLQRSLAWFN